MTTETKPPAPLAFVLIRNEGPCAECAAEVLRQYYPGCTIIRYYDFQGIGYCLIAFPAGTRRDDTDKFCYSGDARAYVRGPESFEPTMPDPSN